MPVPDLLFRRLLRHVFADEATGYNDVTLKGDLAESWQGGERSISAGRTARVSARS